METPPVPAAQPAAQQPPAAVPAAPAQQAAPAAQPPAPADKPDAGKPAPVTVDGIEIKLPADARVDPKDLDAFKAKAKDIGLSSKQAQALAEYQLASARAKAKADDEQVQKQRAADLEALKSDKDFGGSKFDKTVAAAKSAVKEFFGEEGSKLFEALGVDNHPVLVKGCARIRAAIAEDSISGTTHDAGDTGNSRTAELKKMFPKSPEMFT